MTDVSMDIDGLGPPAQPGLKGVAGGLLERLEREAIAEQADIERREKLSSTAAAAISSESSSHSGLTPAATTKAVGGTYVPGATKIPPFSTASGSSLPSSSTSSAGPSIGTSAKIPLPASTTVTASVSISTVPSDPEPIIKKLRRQPTVRLTVTFPPYPPNKEPLARHVPIFLIHDLAERQGLLLPPEEIVVDDASSSSASDDENENDDKAEDSNAADETTVEKDTSEMTESQSAVKAAIDLAKRNNRPILAKKRIKDRDEGYDVNDDFVDDSELLINEPKFQPKPKIEGYCAIVGEVEVIDNDKDLKSKKGRKFGSVNKPKVTVMQADGTTKRVSEAIVARDSKKQKPADIVKNESTSASESPAPPPAVIASGMDSRASSSQTATSKGPLISRDAAMYSHLPSSTSASVAQTPPTTSKTSSTSTPFANGSRMSPIDIDNIDDGDTSMADQKPSSTPAPRPTNVFAFDPSPSKGSKKYGYYSVSAELQAGITRLENAVAKESFVPKNKFPPALKPVLTDVALLAMDKGEYDENFFNIMPNIFPYNRFTMNKMIKREVCEPRCEILEGQMVVSIRQLRAEVNKTLPELKASYDEQHKTWEKEYAEWKRSRPEGAVTSQRAGRATSLTPVASDGDTSAVQPAPTGDDGPIRPKPKFKFSEPARMHLWRIMTMSNEVVERKTEKAEVEGVEIPSGMNATKARYSELVKLWPDGWMTTNQLSREMTAAKKKIEKTLQAGPR